MAGPVKSAHRPWFRWPAPLAAIGCFGLVSVAHAQAYSRTDVIVYRDDTNAWVLGQVESQLSTGVLRDNKDVLVETDRTQFDLRGLPWKTFRFGKLQQVVTYNPDGTIATVSDGKANTTTFAGWKRGIPQSVQYADQTVRSAVVNEDGLIDSITDELSNKTCYEYDLMGRVRKITYPSEQPTLKGQCRDTSVGDKWVSRTFAYEVIATAEYGIPGGHWRRIEQAGNYRKLTYYDGLLRPLVNEEYDASDALKTHRWSAQRYDEAGRVSFQSYPRNLYRDGSVAWDSVTGGTRFYYDALGRSARAEQDSELGQLLVTTTRYLASSRVEVTDPGMRVTTSWFRAVGEPGYDQLIRADLPEGTVVEVNRNSLGLPFSIRRRATDSRVSLTREYVYDAAPGRGMSLCKTVEPETGSTVMSYDGSGNVEWSASGVSLPDTVGCDYADAWASGRAVQRQYDARNRLSKLQFPDKNGDQDWLYWADGLPRSITTLNDLGASSVVNAYEYNGRRLLSGESSSQLGHYTWTAGYGYDALGSPSTVSYPDGLMISYAPNALGQPTQVADVAAGGARFARDILFYPNGAIRQFTYGNGIGYSMVLNARQLPARVMSSGGVLDLAYAFDAGGNVAAVTDQAPGSGFSRVMTYDGLNRLNSVQSAKFGGGGVHRFSYDALDNITSWTGAGKDYASYYYEPTSQRLMNIRNSAGAAVVGLDYDRQGNLAAKNGQHYEFDLGNRLRSVRDKEDYRYDGQGRRVRAAASTGVVLSMYGQQGQLLFEENARVVGVEAQDHVYLQGSTIATVKRNYTSGVVAVEYDHTDALGSPVAKTNGTGQVIERTDYEPYGAAINKPAYQGIGYTGHVMDGATGLTYMQQRYYDPSIGRFLSVDPVTVNSGTGANFNRYWYANDNPYRYTDPDGRCADHHKDGSCMVTVDAGTGRAGTAAGERLESVLNKYDRAINKLSDKANVSIHDRKGNVIGSMTGREIKNVWNNTHFRVTNEQFNNGGAGGGTSGEWSLLGTMTGTAGLNPQAVSSYEDGATARGLPSHVGDNTLIFHELGHLTYFGRNLSEMYPATDHPGPEFWKREQPTSSAGEAMATSVGALFACEIAGGCR